MLKEPVGEVAVMIASVISATDVVVTPNPTCELEDVIVAEDGTTAWTLSDVKLIVTPATGAGPTIDTNPVSPGVPPQK